MIDEVKARLPSLVQQLPPSITVHVLGDRSVTVRAAIADMKLTLGITIGLVVAVLFLFLRRLWPTVIPSIAIPVSLICAGGVMYVLGYSLDNLSFMGLAIAVGFVVDDAIVMIENISRHVEAGEKPVAAAARGRGRYHFHHPVDDSLPPLPLRQGVLTLPIPLRLLCATDARALSEILRILYRCLSSHLLSAAHLDKHRARTGAVTFIRRFGGSVNLNIHFHILALDGVYRLLIHLTARDCPARGPPQPHLLSA